MKKSKTTASRSANCTIAMFQRLKREQIDNVKVLIKVMPKMIAARAHQMTSRERQALEEKIEYCKERVRFCYYLYSDAVALLGPKPKWLMADAGRSLSIRSVPSPHSMSRATATTS